MRSLFLPVAACAFMSACTQAPPVHDSREILWQRFGNRKLDELLMAWGAPTRESHLTDGSRLLTYRHATVYVGRAAMENASSCEVSFLAALPSFRITDVAMQGTNNECHILAQGRIGETRVPVMADPYPYRYPYPYYRYPF